MVKFVCDANNMLVFALRCISCNNNNDDGDNIDDDDDDNLVTLLFQ